MENPGSNPGGSTNIFSKHLSFTMKLQAVIETGSTGLWYGRFRELPGTHARAESLELLLHELDAEAFYHDTWLGLHGEKPLGLVEVAVDVVERVDGIDMLGESGGVVALFEYDLGSPSSSHIQKCIRYMGYHRCDLFTLISGIDEEKLHHTPAGKKRDIVQILRHICNAEEWYISRLGADADKAYEKNLGMKVDEADKLPINERLSTVRRACVATLNEIIPEKHGVFKRADYTSYPHERWTAKKVMRRFLEHEREHIYNIRWYLGRDIRAFP